MCKKLSYILCVSALVCFPSGAQEKKVDKANSDFSQYAYSNAIGSYEDLVKKGMSSREIYKRLGDANFYNARYTEAALWYEKLYILDKEKMESDFYHRYALTLKSLEKYRESDLVMERLRGLDNYDSRVQQFNKNPDYRESIGKNSGRYTINNISINSDKSDYAPAIYLDQLVFSTARDTGIVSRNINEWDGNPFNNLYSATVSENGELVGTAKFSPNLNTRTHEASAIFTKDGSTIYFTRNNSRNGKFARDGDGVSRLKIYKAELRNGDWTDITELPFNSDGHSVAHPCLSADEKTLYFASDMPGTKGASDIFSVTINADGSYGPPTNLESPINTESRETFPFVSSDNILYFASDGHPGLGGLDVFATPLKSTSEIQVLNLGKPINSTMDDFSYIIDMDTNKGYFASNRKGGVGSDDIYSFVQLSSIPFSCSNLITGTVRDSRTGEFLAGTELVLTKREGESIVKNITSKNGTFTLEAGCSIGNHNIIATKTGYETENTPVTLRNTTKNKELEILLSANIEEVKIGTDLAISLDLEPVYFDLDRSVITKDAKIGLNEVVAYMKQYPHSSIQIRSHTDALGDAAYNLQLSKKRAHATMAYLIEKGIEPTRLSSEGFGETRPTNHCHSGVKCSEDEYLKNRRSEFIVTE
ncbi:flagellar motor protein MotB [Arenibacter sp. N53]|uniref:OmpA family protein n=1 Tax=Arenibacter TaxID=178469 RepID=UPI000CD3ADFF|nr:MULTISPECIES: OmpA family protein [Arenibacter]MCM4151189.1 flagellar motor protein MotB [Arenibacter sp. N53]